MNTASNQSIARRHFFRDCGVGVGKIALASLLGPRAVADSTKQNSAFHFAGKAKRVIYLFMAGAPSQLELFDYKPKLKELEGKPLPPSVIKGQRYAFIQPDAAVLGPRFKFAKHGQSGCEISEMLPHFSRDRRRCCLGAFGAHRQVQSRTSSVVHEYGQRNSRPPGDGLLVELRTG